MGAVQRPSRAAALDGGLDPGGFPLTVPAGCVAVVVRSTVAFLSGEQRDDADQVVAAPAALE
jgi:hypothetical protein